MDTLTILVIPVYNGTEVVCVATFFDGSPIERTLPVMLFIGLLIQRHTISKLRLLVYILQGVSSVRSLSPCTCVEVFVGYG